MRAKGFPTNKLSTLVAWVSHPSFVFRAGKMPTPQENLGFFLFGSPEGKNLVK
jgi:hypothetical protein